MKVTEQSYPCQMCGDIFQRQLEGSLLCKECRLVNKFQHLNDDEIQHILYSYLIFPMYKVLKNKKDPILTIEQESGPQFFQQVKKQLKVLNTNPLTSKRYRIIKQVIKFLDKNNYIGQEDKFRGIYFHTLKSNDILFIHEPLIQDDHRIVHIDLDGLEKKLEYEMSNSI